MAEILIFKLEVLMFFNWENKNNNDFYLIAQSYFDKQDYNSALESINNIENIESNEVALQLKTKILKALNLWDNALDVNFLLLKFNPNNADILNNIANIYYKQGNYKEALNYYNKAIQINPAHELAIRNKSVAEAKLKIDKYKNYKNSKVKNADINEYLQHAQDCLNKAEKYILVNNFINAEANCHKAIKFYQKIIELDQSNKEAIQGKLIAENNFKIYKTLNNTVIKNTERLFEEAKKLYSEEKYEDAIQKLSYLIINVNNSYRKDVFYSTRGDCYKELEQFNNAIKDYTKAIQLNPIELNPKDMWEVYSSRGDCYKELKQFYKAIEDYTKAIKFNPEVILYTQRGLCYSLIGEYEQAMQNYSASLNINPTIDTYCYRALLYLKLNEPEKTRADLSKALEICQNEDEVNIIKNLLEPLNNNSKYINMDLLQKGRKIDL